MCDPESAGMSTLAPGGGVTPPSGTCHLISPVFRSYAVSCDHGGPIAVIALDGLSMKS